MLIRVGETTAPGPDGSPQTFRVIQALDPLTEFPIAQIPVPLDQAEAVGEAIAGKKLGAGIVLPASPPVPPDLSPN